MTESDVGISQNLGYPLGPILGPVQGNVRLKLHIVALTSGLCDILSLSQ